MNEPSKEGEGDEDNGAGAGTHEEDDVEWLHGGGSLWFGKSEGGDVAPLIACTGLGVTDRVPPRQPDPAKQDARHWLWQPQPSWPSPPLAFQHPCGTYRHGS